MRHLPFSLLCLSSTLIAFLGCSASPSDATDESASSLSRSERALVEVTSFGSNPGALKMFEYVPTNLPAAPAIVVVMHGCQQDALAIARSGFNDVAERRGFVVVYPQQASANNPMKCFNWGGVYGDLSSIARGQDENESIKQMVDKSITLHGADRARVFVTGFSAGGGMASVMAATWPDVFSGAATIAGIPYRCNDNFMDTFNCMKPGVDRTPAEWAARAKRGYEGYAGPLPRMSVWQGTKDTVVAPKVRNEIVEQWTEVHGVGQTPSVTETVDGAKHTVFKDAAGEAVVESFEIPDMEHAVAVAPSKGCGAVAQYAVDKGICTAARIASFFGIEPR